MKLPLTPMLVKLQVEHFGFRASTASRAFHDVAN